MKKANISVTGSYDDKVFKQLFGDDIFTFNHPKIEPSAIEREPDPIDEIEDFFIANAIRDGEKSDEQYRDRYGNYIKGTYYHTKMIEAGLPFGDDRSPDIEAEDDFIYY